MRENSSLTNSNLLVGHFLQPTVQYQVVTCVSNRHVANQCIVTLRRLYPGLPILARATDGDHQKRLTNTLDVMAKVPVLPEDSLLLNLPFGGAVLKVLH